MDKSFIMVECGQSQIRIMLVARQRDRAQATYFGFPLGRFWLYSMVWWLAD